MFKRLVSNLPFSPSLVEQLGFYAQRLKKEEALRRLGLIFTVFALIIQSFAVFSPPESANASNSNDMCPGVTRNAAGAKKIKACYDNNTRHYREIMDYFGISKSELWKALDGSLSYRSTSTYKNWYTFGHEPRFSGEKNYSGKVPGDLYARKWDHKNNIDNGQWGWKGKQGDTEFIILVDCGNLALKRLLNPSAKCVSLTASKQEITAGDSIILTAKSSTDDGAEISKYDFSQSGAANATHTVKTSSELASWNQTLSKAGNYRFTVNIDTTSSKDNITSKSCSANVTVVEKTIVKNPFASCDQLTVTPTSGVKGSTFNINATASAGDGAKIVKYNFTASSNSGASYSWSNTTANNSSTWSLTPTAAGAYSTSVSVDTSIGAKTSSACNASFTVTEPASAACDLLKVEQLSRTQYKLSATASTSNGASITGYSYIIRDSGGSVVKEYTSTTDAAWTVDLPDNSSVHNAVSYTAILTVHTSLGDQTSVDCEKTIVIPALEQCEYNPDLPVGDPDCKPADCVSNPDLEGCGPDITLIKSAKNTTQNSTGATEVTANGGDIIVYTITATNSGKASGSIDISDVLTDTLEYATVSDNGGANFDANTKTLSWGDVEVGPAATVTRTFAITVNNPISSMAQNHGTPESYDCVMSNVVSKDGEGVINIPVDCPIAKTVVEQTVKKLPATGPTENLLFGGAVMAVVVFFYSRSRQLGKEVRLIRREFNAGTL